MLSCDDNINIPKVSIHEGLGEFELYFKGFRRNLKKEIGQRHILCKDISDKYQDYLEEYDPKNVQHSMFAFTFCYEILPSKDYSKFMKDLKKDRKCNLPGCPNRARINGCWYCEKKYGVIILCCDDHMKHVNSADHLNMFPGI